MKRVIAFMLCLVLALSLPVVAATADTVYEGNSDYSTALFIISGDANKGGQEFVPGSDILQGIRMYLQNDTANNTATLTVYEGSIATNSSAKVVVQETMTLEKSGKGWYELMFSAPVTVTPNELYSFSVNTVEYAALFGLAGGDGSSCKGLNYDSVAYGGWTRGHSTAFQLITREDFQGVIDLINALPTTLTLEDEEQVIAARQAYNALSSVSRAKVTNLATLTAAEETIANLKTADRDAAVAEIQQAIASLGTITRNSRDTLESINKKMNEYSYIYGNYQNRLIENTADYETAIAAYNEIIDYLHGDVNADEAINAKDALEVLKAAVSKITLTEKQGYAADVTNDSEFNAKDALMILQFSVGKRLNFPSQELIFLPYEQQSISYSQETLELFANTYGSMMDRIREDGYAPASVTGAYEGMFPRDSSIQVMAHVAQGDYDQARMILNYLTEYHETNNHDYVIHIIRANPSFYKQADTNFFFLHAWYLFATKAPQTAENKAYIEGSYDTIKQFANYYLDQGYLHDKYDLIFNESLEHTRDGSYWQAYDLVTNVYASQALHELSEYFKTSDPTNAKKWEDAATRIAAGIHKNLVAEVEGKNIYAELRGRSQKAIDSDADAQEKFISGFSWVNLAPMGCDWYAADPDILDHTYQMYLKYGSYRYTNRRYTMLEACTNYYVNKNVNRQGNHVIGKGLAWELLYCHKMGYTDRLIQLVAFLEENSETMYRETWVYSGGGADTANQEQCSWMLYAHKNIFPELESEDTPSHDPEPVTSLRVGTYNIYHLGKINGNAQTIANVISDHELDVVGLQEVDKNVGRDGPVLDQAKAIAEALGWYYGFSKAITLAPGEYGNAIISKYPIESYTTVSLESGSEEQRVMGHAVINLGDTKVNLLNCHLSFTGLNSSQVVEVKNYVAQLDDYILTGDFNTSPANLAPIGASVLMNSGIDNILVKDYTLGEATTVNNTYSDHKMIYTDVSLEKVVIGARIGTYNIHILQDVSNSAATIAKDITDNGLEIVGLQEVDNKTGRNGCTFDQAKKIADELGWYYGFSKAITLGSGEYGNAIISKYPIESYTTVSLESGTEEQRVMGHAVINAGGKKINVMNVHLSWQSMQATQIAQIATYVKEMDNFVITGDYNTSDTSLIATLGGTAVNQNTFVTNEDGAIDNIVVKGFTVGKGTMVETGHSDHNMLYADVTF